MTRIKRSDALKQCVSIRAEIKQLEKEISDLKSHEWEYSTDCVLGSSLHEPYQQHPITIGSYSPSYEVVRGVSSRVKKLAKFQEQLVKSQNDAEDYLQTVSCSIDRVILRGYYIDGKHWNDVAADLTENTGRDYNENRIKKRAQRFFEKN